jgi:hypothetical protein
MFMTWNSNLYLMLPRKEQYTHQERNKSEKFLFLVSFYLFFVYGHKIMCHRYMFFMWKKSKKNVASYCKLVTFSFKFVAVCHYILQVVRRLFKWPATMNLPGTVSFCMFYMWFIAFILASFPLF